MIVTNVFPVFWGGTGLTFFTLCCDVGYSRKDVYGRLPIHYLSNQTGVQDLVDMLGDRYRARCLYFAPYLFMKKQTKKLQDVGGGKK